MVNRVYVERSGRRIAPFGDPAGEAPILNRPLALWQERMLGEAGLRAVPGLEPPTLVIPDTLFSTGATLRCFIERAGGRDAVLVLGHSLFGRTTTPIQTDVEAVEGGWRFARVRFVSGRDDPPVDIVIDPDEQVRRIELPVRFVEGQEPEFPLVRRPVLTLHHWAHILWANQTAGLTQLRNTPAWKLALRGLWASLRERSTNKWKILAKLSRIGRGCDIHPTAVVEASTLGDGVVVGPHARVLASTIGDGAMISAAAQVEASSIGERAFVAQGTCVRCCVLYPESAAGQAVMQQCVLGRRAITTPGTAAIDLNVERPIQVLLDGQLCSSGTHFLGSAFGHGSWIGTGVWIAPGREIPNGAFVVRDPRHVVCRISDGLNGSGPLVNDGGELRPLR